MDWKPINKTQGRFEAESIGEMRGAKKTCCSIFRSFLRISRRVGSQFSFFSSLFSSFLMVYVYKNEEKIDQK